MSTGRRLCRAGVWTPTHQMPSFGFVYLTNVSGFRVGFQWRAFTGSIPVYWSNFAVLEPGERRAIWFGLPTLYVQFEVNPQTDVELFGT